MALRGNVDWLGEDACEMVTNEGKGRVAANHTRPNWVMMSGQLGGKPASISVMGHPKNFRAPQHVRTHPDKPYFCFAPMVTDDFSFAPEGKDYVSRYRYYVSNEKLEKDWIEEHWKRYSLF